MNDGKYTLQAAGAIVVLLIAAIPGGGALERPDAADDPVVVEDGSVGSCQLSMGQTQCVSDIWTYRTLGSGNYEIPDLRVDPAAVGQFTVKIQAEPPYHGEWIEVEFQANGALVFASDPEVGQYGVPWADTPVRTYGYSDGGMPLTSVTATYE